MLSNRAVTRAISERLPGDLRTSPRRPARTRLHRGRGAAGRDPRAGCLAVEPVRQRCRVPARRRDRCLRRRQASRCVTVPRLHQLGKRRRQRTRQPERIPRCKLGRTRRRRRKSLNAIGKRHESGRELRGPAHFSCEPTGVRRSTGCAPTSEPHRAHRYRTEHRRGARRRSHGGRHRGRIPAHPRHPARSAQADVRPRDHVRRRTDRRLPGAVSSTTQGCSSRAVPVRSARCWRRSLRTGRSSS
jgi:hypothetical protein